MFHIQICLERKQKRTEATFPWMGGDKEGKFG